MLPQVSPRFLEGDPERMMLEHGGEVEVPQIYLDPAFKHNRRRAVRFLGDTDCQWNVPLRSQPAKASRSFQ